MTGHADDPAHTITVQVEAGGALRSLSLAGPALRLGPIGLADAILDLVDTATARANQRERFVLRDRVGGIGDEELDALGFGGPGDLIEAAETTTPETWRVS